MLSVVGCTKTAPEFEVLDEDRIPRPQFAGNTVLSLSTSNSASTFNIQGECDQKIRAIMGQAIGSAVSFSGLSALAVSGISVTCAADQKFSFTLKSLADLGFTPQAGETYEVQLRGETSAGISKPSSIKITFTAAGLRTILAGPGGLQSPNVVATTGDGLIKAEVRVGGKGFATTANPSFKAKVGNAAR